MAFEDVLSGLPTSEPPKPRKLRRGPSRARTSRSSRFSAPHRSDRSAEPVRLVHQGSTGSDHFDDLLRVLVHSSVLARFCVNSGVGFGIGIVLVSPRGATFEFPFPIEVSATNDQVEYHAILKGIQLLKEIKADAVEIFEEVLS